MVFLLVLRWRKQFIYIYIYNLFVYLVRIWPSGIVQWKISHRISSHNIYRDGTWFELRLGLSRQNYLKNCLKIIFYEIFLRIPLQLTLQAFTVANYSKFQASVLRKMQDFLAANISKIAIEFVSHIFKFLLPRIINARLHIL